MEIRGVIQLKLLKNIINRLNDGEKYTKAEIANASGDIHNFHRSHLMKKLLINGFLIQKSKEYEFKRVLLFAWYEDNFNVKVPFRW